MKSWKEENHVNQDSYALFIIDFKKVYDSVWHQWIMVQQLEGTILKCHHECVQI